MLETEMNVRTHKQRKNENSYAPQDSEKRTTSEILETQRKIWEQL